jgi:hypothetical protein
VKGWETLVAHARLLYEYFQTISPASVLKTSSCYMHDDIKDYILDCFNLTQNTNIHVNRIICAEVMPMCDCIFPNGNKVEMSTFIKAPWPESASELYRPSDRRLSAKIANFYV